MLEKASRHGLQVILLTCDPERSQADVKAECVLLSTWAREALMLLCVVTAALPLLERSDHDSGWFAYLATSGNSR